MANHPRVSSDSDLEINESIYRVSRIVCKTLFPLFFTRKIVGIENIPADGPAILASKHTCWFDWVTASCFTNRMMYTFAKSAFFDTSTSVRRLRRWCFKKMGAFNINRKEDEIGIRPSDIDRILQPVNEGSLLLIYPEGTRVRGCVGELEKGLALAVRIQAVMNSDVKLPIIPLSPAYSQRPFPSIKSYIPFCERVKVALVVGKPIYYNGEPIREFTRILKEKLLECYAAAGSLLAA